jgi:FMN-dependent NADH-azoreductase
MPRLDIIYRDLAAEPPPHLSGFEFNARQPGSPASSPAAQADLAMGVEILKAFLGTDIVVLGAPMYNFGFRANSKPGSTASSLPEKHSAIR